MTDKRLAYLLARAIVADMRAEEATKPEVDRHPALCVVRREHTEEKQATA